MKLCDYCEGDFLFLHIGVLPTLLYDPEWGNKYHLTLKYPVNLTVNLL